MPAVLTICSQGRHGGLALSVIRRGERMVLCATCGRLTTEKVKVLYNGAFTPSGEDGAA